MEEKQPKEFIYFLNVAKASSYEVKSQLYLSKDLSYLSANEFDELYKLCDEISKTIFGLIKHLENNS